MALSISGALYRRLLIQCIDHERSTTWEEEVEETWKEINDL